MKTIGITGGIGCGKSAVLALIENNYNARIVEADRVGHEVMEKGGEAYNKIVDYFTEDILDTDRNIDRKKLASIVFNNKEKLEKLNSFVHPAVKHEIIRRKEQAQKDNIDFFIIEAALLIEAGYRDICDKFIYIYANENVRRERLRQSRGMTDEKINEVMKNQLSEDVFTKMCDYKVDNSGKMEETFEKLKKILVL